MAGVAKKKDLLDRIGDLIAHYRGLPVLLGVALVILNYVLVAVWPSAEAVQASNVLLRIVRFVVVTHLFLHLGVIVGLLGVLLGDAL